MPESYRKKAVLVPYSELFNSCCKRRRAFAEIYGRNPRENPCLIPKRKNRCFRIKSLLGAERMPQGQYITNAAGIGEQSVNTGIPRAAAGASPLRRRSPGGLSRWFLRTGSKSIPRPALAGSPLPFLVWVQALGWLCSFSSAMAVVPCGSTWIYPRWVNLFALAIPC